MENLLFRTLFSFSLFFISAGCLSAAGWQVLSGNVPREVAKFHLQSVGELPVAQHLHLGISLPFRNNETLSPLLQDLYNPASPSFHHYLTPDQFNQEFAPSAADYQAVLDFSKTNGFTITHTVRGRSLVEVDAAVADINRAFHLTLRQYPHPTEGRTFYAPDAEPSLDLAVPILAISGLDDYVKAHAKAHPLDRNHRSSPRGGSYNDPTNGNLFIGSDFRHAYIPDSSLNGSGQEIGLYELDGYTPADITAYERSANLPNVPFQEVLEPGVQNDPDNGDGEPPADIQMAISMAPGISKVVFYYWPTIDGMLTEMADPSQGEGLPLQLSDSYGNGVDGGTANCFARLAAQGQSFFYAVGDESALPVDPNGPNGTYINGAAASDLEPYMTQVGGTDLAMSGSGVAWTNETVWGASGPNPNGGPDFSGSSGGIQTTVPIPDYQGRVNMTAVGGSASQRNVPDVAAAASSILVVVTGTNGVQGYGGFVGTSLATPLWAGFTALVNEQAAADGLPPLGFINPALYNIGLGATYTTCFHDITSGNNTWSNSPTLYYSAPGYDLCTGWGSPKGVNLLNTLLDFTGPVFVDFNYTGPASNGQNDGPGSYNYPFKTLAQGVSAVSSYGTIIIKTAGSSSETMTISKPMNINASGGPATIGD